MAIRGNIHAKREHEFDLHELAEEFVDVADSFQIWRFRHMRTVERIIGHARGTGGSAGVAYLHKAIERWFSPELREVRTTLV